VGSIPAGDIATTCRRLVFVRKKVYSRGGVITSSSVVQAVQPFLVICPGCGKFQKATVQEGASLRYTSHICVSCKSIFSLGSFLFRRQTNPPRFVTTNNDLTRAKIEVSHDTFGVLHYEESIWARGDFPRVKAWLFDPSVPGSYTVGGIDLSRIPQPIRFLVTRFGVNAWDRTATVDIL
jgi:hypothetical protein